jgi:Phage tail lysozyme
MRKVARRAGKAAPAVAVLGALAATPQVRALAFGSPPAAAGQQLPDHSVVADQARSRIGESLTQYSSRLYRSRHAKIAGTDQHGSGAPSPSASASASPSPTSSSPSPSASPSPSSSSPPASGSGAAKCSASASGMLPENYAAIVTFLTAHGYTGLAAAGIAGNIYQESKGNPESVGSGGGGLIGWTPLPSGFVTGNVAADLQTQLSALLTYNQQWSQYIPPLNAASSAASAAYIYMADFERPGIPAAGNREAAATAVAQACGL